MLDKTIEQSLAIVGDFLQKIAGPAAEEYGLALKDKAKLYRLKNLTKIIKKADKFCKDSNLEINEIPLRTLIPIIESASLEDNEILMRKWASLIVNAATCNTSLKSHPSYAQILRELSPIEALFLDELSSFNETSTWPSFGNAFQKKHSLTKEDIDFIFWNLFRLGLTVNAGKGYKFTQLGKFFIKACQKP